VTELFALVYVVAATVTALIMPVVAGTVDAGAVVAGAVVVAAVFVAGAEACLAPRAAEAPA